MKKTIIGLTGLAGAGKDTVADLLCTHAGFVKLAFADTLRAEIVDAFGIGLELLTERHTKEEPTPALMLTRGPVDFANACVIAALCKHPEGMTREGWADFMGAWRSPREIMQLWGTEYRRKQNEKYWTQRMTERATFALRHHSQRIVVTDCRFPNEVQWLRGNGGILWQITRPGQIAELSPSQRHASEVDGTQFGPDLILRNDHDIRHLQGLVREAFLELDWSVKS